VVEPSAAEISLPALTKAKSSPTHLTITFFHRRFISTTHRYRHYLSTIAEFSIDATTFVPLSAIEPCLVHIVPWSGKHHLLPCLWSEALRYSHGFEDGHAAAGGGGRETRQDPKLLQRCSVPYFSNAENFPTTDHILISIPSNPTGKSSVAQSSIHRENAYVTSDISISRRASR
jgi:hypothetical protein